MNARMAISNPVSYGMVAFAAMLSLYFGVLALLSGWEFTWLQFSEVWYYVVPLAAGFGLQVTLFVRLRRLLLTSADSKALMAASGTTSTAAMISCCAHYLVNIAPVLGATGLVAFATAYQTEFFWVGLAFNAAGIAYIGNKLVKATRDHAQCAPA